MQDAPLLSKRTKQFSTSGTAQARAAAKAAAEAGKEIIDLTAGEVWTAIPESVREGAASAIRDGVSRYTDSIGLMALRMAIADRLSEDSKQTWSALEVAVTAGAKQALFNTAMVLFNPGDEIIIPKPYWTTFPAQVALTGAQSVFVDTSQSGYVPQPDAIRAKLSECTRAIIVNTPNNPTGAVFDAETLSAIADIALEHKLWIILDNCYAGFVYGAQRAEHFLSIAPQAKPRTIVVNAFSKQLCLTGWRLGYMAAPSTVISAAKALQSHTTSNANVIAQYAVLRYLSDGSRDFESRLLNYLSQNRQLGLTILGDLKFVPSPSAQGAFYFYLDLSELLSKSSGYPRNADEVANQLIADAGVATVPGSAFGDPTGLRLSYGVPPDLLERGLRLIVGTLNAYGQDASPVEAAE